MPHRAAQQVVVAVVVVVWFVLALVTTPGHSLATISPVPLKLYSMGGTAVWLVMLAYDRLLWKTRVARWARPVPVLSGTWRGRLRSTYVASDGETFDDLPVYLLITQTGSSLSATMITARSRSVSDLAHLLRGLDRTWRISWTYVNTPRASERATSAMHNGMSELLVTGVRGERLEGTYFTDRESRGELVFDAWSAVRYRDFDTASRGSEFAPRRSL